MNVYFHGAPGGPAELELCPGAQERFVAPDRFTASAEMAFSEYIDRLAGELVLRAAGEPMVLVGFSAGARVALEVAGRQPAGVSAVELIAPAAPLELGDFLPDMQGRPVFETALHRPQSFGRLVWAQGLLARWAPALLYRIVFAKPAGADAALARDGAFRATVTAIMRESLTKGAAGYSREILDIVRPWSDMLSHVAAPVRIWRGDADNWAPPALSDALASRLPNCVEVRTLPGLSHYSTLVAALTALIEMGVETGEPRPAGMPS